MNARRCYFVFLALSAGVLSHAALAAGADYRRVAPGGGSFFNTARWSPVGVPGASDRAIFDLSSIYAVSFGASLSPTVANQRLRIGDDDVTFDLDGRVYSLTSTSATSLSIGGGGRGFGGVDHGELRIIDGTLRAATAIVGDGPSTLHGFGSGLFQVSSGATFASPGSLLVGAGTTGTFRVDSGGDVDTFLATIGYDAAGTATVTGDGSTWDSDSLDIDNGTLNIQSRGVMKTTGTSGSYVGVTPGRTGVVNVNGEGSEWDTQGPLTIGHGGHGSLNISNEGFVDSHSGVILGNSSGSTGAATVDGDGSRWNPFPTLVVGNMGAGSLAVTHGAYVLGSRTSIGAHPVGTGSVVVSGGARLESPAGLFVGGGEFADGGAATLDIITGGETVVAYFGATKLWGPGTINLNGGRLETGRLELLGGTFNWTAGTLSLASDLFIEPTGLFGAALALDSDNHLEAGRLFIGQHSDGLLSADPHTKVSSYGLVVGGAAEGEAHFDGSVVTTSYDVVIGDEAAAEGTVTFENLGLWNHTTPDPASKFVVGDRGVGTLNILSDSDVLLMGQTLPIVGNQDQGHGTINIDGHGSELFVNIQDLSVGREGTGMLNITNGGLLLAGGNVLVGEAGSGHGGIRIAGGDSMLRAASVLAGFQGEGSLEVVDAGTLEAGYEIVLGLNAGSTATATVNGAGSRLAAVDDGALLVGGAGGGMLTVSGGAIAEAYEVVIGDGTTGVGNVLVTGPGSRLVGREEMLVGYLGEATLTVADGGTVAAPLIEINNRSSVRGDGVVAGDVTSYGVVAPGSSAGLLTIDGDYAQQSDGRLQVELGGTTRGDDYDVLRVTGLATLDGTLDVTLLGSDLPQAGDAFDVLDWGSLAGAFATLNLPSLDGSLTWDSSQLYVTGTLSVISPLSADFDDDGDVDGADLNQWRGDFGVNAFSDADDDGDSDGGDFLAWQRQLGSPVGAPVRASAVPEPGSVVLGASAAVLWILAGNLPIGPRRRTRLR